jgi:amidohydrolase
METVNDFLNQLAAEGVKLSVQAGELNCYAPKGALTSALRDGIARHRTEIMRLLEDRERRSPMVPRTTESVKEFALSAGQKGLYILQKVHPAMGAYNVPLGFRIRRLDVGLLAGTWEAILEQYPILTARVVERDGLPYQRLDCKPTIQQETIEYVNDEQLLDFLKERAKQPFDPNQGPLSRIEVFRWGGEESVVLITLHHLVFDGTSVVMILKALLDFYQQLSEGRTVRLSRDLAGYQEFVAWEEAMLASPEGTAHATYWRKQLEGDLPVFELLPDSHGMAAASFAGKTFAAAIPEELGRWVREFSRAHTLPASGIFLAVLQMVLRRYAEQDDIIVGMPVMGRVQQKFAHDVGYFINMIPLRTRCDGAMTASDFLRRVQVTMLDGLFHSVYPFPRMMESLHVREIRKNPVFQVTYAYQNFINYEAFAPLMQRQTLDATIIGEIAQEGESDLGLEVYEEGANFSVKVKYNPDLYAEPLIRRLFDSYCAVLQGLSEDVNRPLDDYSIVSAAERERVMVDFNDTRADYPADQCLHQLFIEQVATHANEVAAVCGNEQLTYQQLHDRSHDLARHLQSLGVQPDTFVGVCMERSLDMLVAILGTLMAGGAYVPLDPDYPEERLAFTLEDSRAMVVLTQQKLRDMVRGLVQPETLVVAVDGQQAEIAERVAALKAGNVPFDEQVRPHHLSHVIYTSGSTGKPKGVAIEHHSPVTLVHWAREVYSKEELSGVLASTSICFDLSVYEMFVTLASGGTIILVQNALALVDSPHRESVTLINTVPSAMEELVRMGAIPKPVLTINLAGEPLSPRLVDKIYDSSTVGKVYDLYGPSEDTTYSTYTLRRKNGPQTIGRPLANTQVYILDTRQQIQPIGVPGELYIAGDGLARGYLNRPELTQEKFVANPFAPGTRMYRTGDRARWNEDGTLQYLGRIDTQVKIRGFRIEIGEIEVRLSEYSGVQDCAVVAQGEGADRQLVAFYRATETTADHSVVLPPGELRAHLKQTLPDHMVPAAFVSLAAIPLHPNGKVDRRTLTKMDAMIASGEAYVAPRNQAEESLARLFGEVLKREPEKIGVNDNFFELGGHSLVATQLISKIRGQFGVELPLKSIFQHTTVAAIGALIAKSEKTKVPPIVQVDRSQYARLPLSYAEERVWFMHQIGPGYGTLYSVPAAFIIEGELDPEPLDAAFNLIIERHETLRTIFPVHDGQTHRVVLDRLEFRFQRWDLAQHDKETRDTRSMKICLADAAIPFDLATGPLIRGQVIKLAEHEHIVMVNMHHVISDGWSIGVFVQEIREIMDAFRHGRPPALPALPIQYADYAIWQRQLLDDKEGVLKQQLAYWQEKLAGLQVLDMATDYPLPSVRATEGTTVLFQLDAQLTADLKRLAERQGSTLFMVLLAAYTSLLHRYTGQFDICLGTPIANRNYGETEGLIGMFVNTLPLRTQLGGDDTFAALLSKVKATCLEAYENQDAPFARIVDAVQPSRNPAISPLYQQMFILQSADTGSLDQRTQRYFLDTGVAKHDITIEFNETTEGLDGALEYSTALFKPETIARVIEHLTRICRAIVARPAARIRDLDFMAEPEKQRLLVDYNATQAGYAKDKCLHDLFAEQVPSHSSDAAVVCGEERLTYQALYERSRELALYLQSEGVRPDGLVGLCMERSPDMVVAMLAILQAGGAYVALDPAYPEERLAFMLEDSQAGIVLTQDSLRDKLRAFAGAGTKLVALDGDAAEIGAQIAGLSAAGVTLERRAGPDHLAYLIYTSGSTGRPKGVAIEHHSPVTLVQWARDVYSPEELSGVLASTSICFDLSVFEIFVTLASGGTVILVPNALGLVNLPSRPAVTLINTVPSAMEELVRLGAIPVSVKAINLAGEPLSPRLVDKIYETTAVAKVYDLYGPSEDTTYSTYALRHKQGPQTIGRPIANTKVYILDAHHGLQPLGMAGELYLAGDGVARGYLNRPELTQERFIASPFQPGTRMYRTGDRARWTDDGNLQYMGRIDTQVKVRGFRIELGEIETRLNEADGILDSAVVAQGEGADKQLIAFYRAAGTTADEVVSLPSDALRIHLLRTLPDYMLPAAFVSLAAIPLNSSGKVDRRRLEQMDVQPASREEYAAPRNSVEDRLVAIWADVLKLPAEKIGIYDNFFELGGHSLSGVQLISRINDRFRRSLSLAVIFTTTNVAAFAEMLSREESETTSQELAIPIQPGGDEPPIFGVPGAGGVVLWLQPLSRALGKNQPFYGLQAVGLDGTTAPLNSVEETARVNLGAVKKVQPLGPYRFIGHSYGGVVAYEMARQLLEQGEEVASLTLLDSPAPWAVLLEDEQDDAAMLSEAYAAFATLYGVDVELALKRLRPSDEAENVRQLLALLSDRGLEIREEQFAAFRDVYRANLLAYRDYKPVPLSRAIDVSLYRATKREATLLDDYGWSYLLQSPMRAYDIVGDHRNILERVRFDGIEEQTPIPSDASIVRSGSRQTVPTAGKAVWKKSGSMDTQAGARERLDLVRSSLIDLSHRIHAHPELGFEEEQASTWLCEALSAAGFKVDKGVYGLPTAFIARAGSGPLHIAICAEYDALPGIGHACGHNLIAASAVGAAIAAARVADDVGLTVTVIGSPAEEVGDGGGKILLLERGAFAGVHAAMMVHPSPLDIVETPVVAAAMFDIRYTGKEAHAAAFPELGINAADALTIAQTAIGLMRQHIRTTDKVHGIITKGGDAPNIVPAHTSARYMVRAETLDDLDEIRNKVHRCFEAGAVATGSKLEILGGHKPYSHMRHNADLAASYKRNAEKLGRFFPDLDYAIRQRISAATDMGNVSLVLPAIHPMIGIGSLPAMNHQPEFTAHCATEAADKAIIDGALAMAWTAIDMAEDEEVRERFTNVEDPELTPALV